MTDFLQRRNKIISMIRNMDDMWRIIDELAKFEKDVYKAGEENAIKHALANSLKSQLKCLHCGGVDAFVAIRT